MAASSLSKMRSCKSPHCCASRLRENAAARARFARDRAARRSRLLRRRLHRRGGRRCRRRGPCAEARGRGDAARLCAGPEEEGAAAVAVVWLARVEDLPVAFEPLGSAARVPPFGRRGAARARAVRRRRRAARQLPLDQARLGPTRRPRACGAGVVWRRRPPPGWRRGVGRQGRVPRVGRGRGPGANRRRHAATDNAVRQAPRRQARQGGAESHSHRRPPSCAPLRIRPRQRTLHPPRRLPPKAFGRPARDRRGRQARRRRAPAAAPASRIKAPEALARRNRLAENTPPAHAAAQGAPGGPTAPRTCNPRMRSCPGDGVHFFCSALSQGCSYRRP
mmetsp:Transcript_16971/g.57386  ORF Transcript_16971/g.57386 Transcript_16971/m.57386 type:complete len:335 (-) Transcript_16971:4-1008(-)